jgi:hypothetical protein
VTSTAAASTAAASAAASTAAASEAASTAAASAKDIGCDVEALFACCCCCEKLTWDRCYDFKNIFANKIAKKLAFFTQNYAKI